MQVSTRRGAWTLLLLSHKRLDQVHNEPQQPSAAYWLREGQAVTRDADWLGPRPKSKDL